MVAIVRRGWVDVDVFKFARKNDKPWTLLALRYAKLYFQGMYRKDGRDAFVHAYKVAQILIYFGVWDDEVIAAGILHDILEDVSYAALDVLSQVFPQRTVSLVVIVTKFEGVILAEYFHNISLNPFTVLIKLADRLHNLRNMIKNLDKKHCFNLEKLREQSQETNDFVVRLPYAAIVREKTKASGCPPEYFSAMAAMAGELREAVHLAKVILAGLVI
ncbi:MAG: HD domain-containing protein [Candidatus Moranbacteria bacterium]|nr:HD domain-containing protein [Candidatus Moranbacteria bacterium]